MNMLETPHVAVGAAIATSIPNPALSIPLAFASHFVLDMLPHWNPHTFTETQKNGRPSNKTIAITALDISIAAIVGVFAASRVLPNTAHATTILVASFASILPDVSKYPFFLIRALRKGFYLRWVEYERSLQNDVGFVPGIISQLVIFVTALFSILKH